ncbi:MAG TPA: HAD family hydrolase [Xanthomonadaceae bacterium]|nr:HAD family hydrolase [Xanthomonadaceae bacterium]
MIRALTLDLDDTLWAVAPALARAELALEQWLHDHCPAVAERFPVATMRALRERLAAERPDLAHDYTGQRRLSIAAAFAACGQDDALVDAAFEAFYTARNQVEIYADVAAALRRIAARVPIVSVSNGNADLRRIGLHPWFHDQVSARAVGVAKPDPRIFHVACERVGCHPSQVLHVGDDPHLDVAGARAAGLRAAWIDRHGAPWPDLAAPELSFTGLDALADWVETHAVRPAPVAEFRSGAAAGQLQP